MAAHLTTRTDQPYVYEDLNLERPAFRLVRLFSGDGPELKCELLQAFIDERESIIPYEAVSYTWGHINLSRSIDIDGKSLGITASLHVALQHFRYTDRDRIIWVDGICINQSNQKERGHQVQQMAYIYRQAERVIFWLGWATNDTDEFVEAFQRLTKQSMQLATASWAVRDARWHCMWVALQPASRILDPELLSALRQGLVALLARPWFRRA
ncbi:ankyrin repeat and sam domain containing protein 6 [Colletotrichum plurivorum]|uniref:Ankyrin repeat and sam domain containing protein 6 n=1 Tax=Colletotrichum plurivorum TaxID=2175906 RepID=A0A8H6NDB2_9PEZI|nr:ankyrin repeat and sam domain containing protein 6 [Colletotrichum plurivorum]